MYVLYELNVYSEYKWDLIRLFVFKYFNEINVNMYFTYSFWIIILFKNKI